MLNPRKTSFLYYCLFTAVKWYFHLFYKKVIITGRTNIPENVPLIFAANHQNALMDALAILFAVNRPVVFLARADIFKKASVARLLYFLKILPVFRMRDGIDNMSNNTAIFEKTVEVLEAGLPIGILPEGTHTDIKHLQPLKKGICRIAFMAAESSAFKLNLNIVPVGIDYAHYQHAGTPLLINFGTPIAAGNYYTLYRENQQKAITMLRDDLAVAIKKEMIDVADNEYYTSTLTAALVYCDTYLLRTNTSPDYIHRFRAAQTLVNTLEEAYERDNSVKDKLRNSVADYLHLLKSQRLRDEQIARPYNLSALIMQACISVLVAPIHLTGILINYLPYTIPARFTKRIKDPQFVSSVNFGLSFLTFLIWYILLNTFILVYTANILIAASVTTVGVLSGLTAFYHYKRLLRVLAHLRAYRLMTTKAALYAHLCNARAAITQIVGGIV